MLPFTFIQSKYMSRLVLLLILILESAIDLAVAQGPPAPTPTPACPYLGRSPTPAPITVSIKVDTGSSPVTKDISLCLADDGQHCIPNDFNWIDLTSNQLKTDGENFKLLEYLSNTIAGSNVSIPLFPQFRKHKGKSDNEPLKAFQTLEKEFMSLFCKSGTCQFASVEADDTPDSYECKGTTTAPVAKPNLDYAAIRQKFYDLMANLTGNGNVNPNPIPTTDATVMVTTVDVEDGNCSYISNTRSKAEFEQSEADIVWREGENKSRIVLCKVKDGFACFPRDQKEANNSEEHLGKQQNSTVVRVRRAARYTRQILYGGPEFLSWNCQSGVCNKKTMKCDEMTPPVLRTYMPWYLGELGSGSKPLLVSAWCFVFCIYLLII